MQQARRSNRLRSRIKSGMSGILDAAARSALHVRRASADTGANQKPLLRHISHQVANAVDQPLGQPLADLFRVGKLILGEDIGLTVDL